jgi:hypothetical protein
MSRRSTRGTSLTTDSPDIRVLTYGIELAREIVEQPAIGRMGRHRAGSWQRADQHESQGLHSKS